MRCLVMSTRSPGRRRDALAPLFGPGDAVTWLPTGATLPALGAFDAIVVDGHPGPRPPGELATLGRRVEQGASLLAIGAAPHEQDGFWAGLLGAVAGDPFPAGEWFGRVGPRPSLLTARIDGEFTLVDRVEPLVPQRQGTQVIVTVRRGMTDHPVVVAHRRGAGGVVASGLGLADEALANPAVAKVLRRALRPASSGGEDRAIGLAVVGYGPFGGMGYYHGMAAAATPGLELVAIVDTSAERRKAAEADFAGVRAYASVDDLLADDGAEVVVVATPPTLHAPLALSMLRAGKHVAVEKPMCLTLAQADELIITARVEDRVLTVHQNRRWDADFLAVRRAVDGGLLGDVFNIETFVGGFDHPCRAWHSDTGLSGGAVYDWGSHHVDWILQLFGGRPPDEVRAFGHKRVWHDVTNLDQVRVRMLWADGREAEFLQSDVAAVRRPKFWVQGTAGTLVGHYRPVAFERMEPGRGYVRDVAHHAEAPADPMPAPYETGHGATETRLAVAPEQRFAFHRNLADHLLLGEPLAVTPESVRPVVAVLEAAQRSTDTGRAPVRLDDLR
jgi:predicted dehydrogenase